MDSNPPPAAPPPRIMPPPLTAGAAPRRRRGLWGLMVLLGVFAVGAVVLGVVLMALGAGGGRSTARLNGRWLEETVLEHAGSRHKIAVIDVEGLIVDVRDRWTGSSLVRFFKDQLECATRDPRVRAVVLRIDSPGGEVLASDEMSQAVAKFQRETGKPVVASLGGLAASGGYYVAAPCRWIVAHEMTLTGSIGVILSSWNFRGLLNKVGIQPQTFKSGRFKDMLSPDKEPSEISAEERAMIQALVDETYGRFTQVVAEGRAAAARENGGAGRALAPGWKEVADGRVLSGRQAHEQGLVDELGNTDTAVERARALAGIADADLVQYHEPRSFLSLLRLFGRAEPPAIKVDLGLEAPPLQAGKLYFLPPSFLP